MSHADTRYRCLLLALAMAMATPALADESFDANLATARQNLASETGAAYDRALGEAIEKAPGLAQALTACMEKFPGNPPLQGYLHFSAPAAYTVVLAPAGPAASCLAKALEGRALPPPPSVPYFNHVTLQ